MGKGRGRKRGEEKNVEMKERSLEEILRVVEVEGVLCV